MQDFHVYLLDLDGVVYRGDRLLAGARELVEWLDTTGHELLYLSNNSLATPEEVAHKLARLGMPRPHGRVLTAGLAAVRAVATRYPGGSVYVLALPPIAAMARDAGMRVVSLDPSEPPPDAVLVGLDRAVTYDRLRQAMRALLAGASFFAVNRDPRLPVEDGFEPGTGALVAALEYATGLRAEMIGKPAPEIVIQAMRLLNVHPAAVLMIGDGLDLDVAAGRAAGVATALVLTGLTSAAQLQGASEDRQPAYVFNDLPALLAAAREGSGA